MAEREGFDIAALEALLHTDTTMEELLAQATNIQKAQHRMQKTVTAGLDDLERIIRRAKEDVTKGKSLQYGVVFKEERCSWLCY